MNDPRLGKYATIKDLIELKTLPDPENYLRNVLENMMACKEEYRTPHVRIGILGSGQFPHYRIEPVPPPLEEYLESPDARKDRYEAFHGRSHKSYGLTDLGYDHWSDSKMSFVEVQSLYDVIREWPKP